MKLSPMQKAVLRYVLDNPGTSRYSIDLREAAGNPRGGVTRTIDSLIRRDLIRLVPGQLGRALVPGWALVAGDLEAAAAWLQEERGEPR